MEGWRDGGRMEGWTDGDRMEGWRQDGGMEGWRQDGGMEGWRDGGMEGWREAQMDEERVDNSGREMRSDAQAKVQAVRSISGSRVHFSLLSLGESPAEV